ncbi:class IIb bacteriocin, lactobin A/cerein 7B family [Sphingobacterium thalpophilum]|uniref:class IIb bacteriocin, lactobin A/cerein 7B family n=1 Tax=Sphingobacterium thalpophilum TaxID=259 RepID=UPI003C725918
MNTLDLKGFGVQEMDAKEMEVIDGGAIPLVAIWIVSEIASVAFAVGVYNGYQNAANR